MLPAAGALPGVVLILTIAFVALGLVLLVVLAPSGRGRAARAVVVAGLLALGLAFFTLTQRSAPERARPQDAPFPSSPVIATVPEPPAPPAVALLRDDDEPDDEPAPPDEESVTITTEMPNVPEFANQLLDAMGSPVRVEGSKLVIGGHVVPPLETGPNSQSGAITERQRRATEVKVRANVRRDAAEQLADYFQKLVDNPPPAVPRLNELRSKLQRLSAGQRARIAEQAARLRTVVTRGETDVTGKWKTGRVELYTPKVEISPEHLRNLIDAELARARSDGDVRTPAKILGTIGVVIGAVAVLKIATRRHCGVNPGR